MIIFCVIIIGLQFLALDYTVFEFSQEPGFLSITDSARAKLNISVVRLYVGMWYAEKFYKIIKVCPLLDFLGIEA